MKTLMTSEDFSAVIEGLASKIADSGTGFKDMAFLGIHTRGVPLAARLAKILRKQSSEIHLGTLDINLYRDDLSQTSEQPILKSTQIDFDLTGKTIYLCDDVLFTGRTIRAAMDAVFDLGRPRAVYLVVMARRTGRELPIDANLFAIDVQTKAGDNIKVKFLETDGEDSIALYEKGEYAKGT